MFVGGVLIDSINEYFPELKHFMINNCRIQFIGGNFKNDEFVKDLIIQNYLFPTVNDEKGEIEIEYSKRKRVYCAEVGRANTYAKFLRVFALSTDTDREFQTNISKKWHHMRNA